MIVECQPRLENLLRGVDGIERVVAQGEPLPPFDYYVRLMSIPGIVGTTPDSIPAGAPYLKIDSTFKAAWKERLHQMCPDALRATTSGKKIQKLQIFFCFANNNLRNQATHLMRI